MEDFRKKFICLCHFPGISWNNIYTTLKRDPQLLRINNINPLQIKNINNQILHYPSKGIEIITYFDELYPSMLKEIYQPPWCLFIKGNIQLVHKDKRLAIVGSREATSYGKTAIEQILPSLIEKKIIIVSGLAKGIDAFAHQTTINKGGKTIGVIAGGFYHLYPKENENLANQMATEHLIVSEYPPDTKPSKWQFPARNRIISGLCEGTLIIEAKRKSGSLITANYAVQEGREVFAIPGSIFSPFSEGTNDLIQQGAKLVMSGEDIISEMRI